MSGMDRLKELRRAASFLRALHAQACFEQGHHKDEVDTTYSLGAGAIDQEARRASQAAPAPSDGLREAAIAEALNCLDGEPEYHENGMGCGLEDRNITDRYEAMAYGWNQAMERIFAEHINPAIDALSASPAQEGEPRHD